MFSKDKPGAPTSETAADTKPAERSSSTISADLHITGHLKSVGNLHVDGTVEGDINGRNVVIGERAVVTGEVDCESLMVCGTVNGEVRAMTVTLASSARVVGDIAHESLTIETGARLEGSVRPYSELSAGSNNGSAAKSSANIPLLDGSEDNPENRDPDVAAQKVGS